MENFEGIKHALTVEMSTPSWDLPEFLYASSAHNNSKHGLECTEFFGPITWNTT
jgi:hypothetical protein